METPYVAWEFGAYRVVAAPKNVTVSYAHGVEPLQDWQVRWVAEVRESDAMGAVCWRRIDGIPPEVLLRAAGKIR